MLAIKLKMVGRRNQRSFRVIVQEARAKVRGSFVEDIGWYNPHTNEFKLDNERVSYWMKSGAQPTETVRSLIKKSSSGSDVETYVGTPKVRKSKKAPKEEATATEDNTEDTPIEVADNEEASSETQEESPVEEAKSDGEPKEDKEETSPKEEEKIEEKVEEPKEEVEEKTEEEEASTEEDETAEIKKEETIEEEPEVK